MTTSAEKFTPSDQSVREEVMCDIDKNFCVEAGAGTGKTTVLVGRIIEVLRRGHATIDEIAVITFTDKATAELAARVRLDLEQALDVSTDPQEKERLHDAMLGLHRAHIETIHAFAANLLRERPVEASLDPNFEVLVGLAAKLAFKRACDAWLEELLGEDGTQDEALRRILDRGLDLSQIEDCASEVHDHRETLPLEPYETTKSPDLDGFTVLLEQACEELREVEASCIDEDDSGYLQIPGILAFGDEIAAAHGDTQRQERLILHRAPPTMQKGRQPSFEDAEDCRRMKHCFKELKGAITEMKSALRQQAMADLLPRVSDFVSRYERRRRADGNAEFTDLLLWARNLVRDNVEVRRYFQDRFRCLLVDEFQDTDPIQSELITLICSEQGSKGEWLTLPLRPGALFVVGDPKQSIYRFRRADMTNYDEVKNRLFAGRVRELRQNFRSVDGVLSWVNKVFDRLFVPVEGIQPENSPLVADPRVEEANGRAAVIVLHGQSPVEKQEELRIAEAEAIAALIKRAVDEEHWQVRDPRSGERRDAQWRDVAVIVPARTGIELYEEAFENASLPYRYESTRSFFQRQEVRDLANCLYAIDDPTNNLSLVAALRSSAFGCSDEEIFLFKSDGGKLDYRVENPPNGHDGVTAALPVLHKLHKDRRQTSLPELVHTLLHRTNLIEFALTDRAGGVQAAGNLLKVVDQARAFAGVGGGGLRSFARWLEDSSDPDQEETEASVVDETDDVVHLLTIHGAKGLEFPIVALANLNSGSASRKGSFCDHASGRLQVYAKKEWVTPGFDDAWQDEDRHHDAERKRMLYVAATRARDHLILPVIERQNGDMKGLAGELADDLPDWEDDRAGHDVDGCHLYDRGLLKVAKAAGRVKGVVPAKADVDQALAKREQWLAERNEVVESADQGLAWVSASSSKGERPLAQEDGTPGGDGGEPVVRIARSTARSIGDALHHVMEVIDLATGDGLEAVVAAMCVEAAVPDEVDNVVQMAQNCLHSEPVKRAVAGGKYWREVSFTVPRKDGGFDVGRVDLVFREGDGLVVVDYKTDRVTEQQDLTAKYSPQAHAYMEGLQSASGEAVRECLFVLARQEPGSGRATIDFAV